jgi:hypothetical protein
MKSLNIALSSICTYSIIIMGNGLSSSSVVKLGSRSTAAEVASFYSNGQAEGFLKGKVAVITGGNSGIGLEVTISSRQFNDPESHHRYNNCVFLIRSYLDCTVN